MGKKKQKDHSGHPLAIRHGEDEDIGKLPHELDNDDYHVWLIEQGMTPQDYDENVKDADLFVKRIEIYGKPIPTAQLTADQKGWAASDYPDHYLKDALQGLPARWFVDPDKPSRPLPASMKLRRTRVISEECECGKKADYAEWSEFHDGRTLLQCEKCGEVVITEPEEEEAA